LFVLGGLAMLAVTWDEPPQVLGESISAGTAPVGWQSFDDKQTVTVTLAVGPRRALQAPVTGQVTGFSCTVGTDMVSGQSVVSVDGVPLLDLATAMPLWRDLEVGDRGTDVVALVAELKRLGHLTVESAEVVDAALLAAYATAANQVGMPASALGGGVIRATQVAWLPAPSLPAGSCEAVVGAQVAPGQILVGFEPVIVGARVGPTPAELAPGLRTLMLGTESFGVMDSGEITAPESLGRLGTMAATREALREGGSGSVVGQLVLAEPIDVAVIPPAALVATGASACVVGDGTPRAVQVIGSQLGQTFVVFVDEPPAAVAVDPPRDLTCA
jgi:hypothetical protein